MGSLPSRSLQTLCFLPLLPSKPNAGAQKTRRGFIRILPEDRSECSWKFVLNIPQGLVETMPPRTCCQYPRNPLRTPSRKSCPHPQKLLPRKFVANIHGNSLQDSGWLWEWSKELASFQKSLRFSKLSLAGRQK